MPSKDEKVKEEATRLLADLEKTRVACGCDVDVREFLGPYLHEVARRKVEGEKFFSFSEYCFKQMVCTTCFHFGSGYQKHLPPMCDKLCCGIKRCEDCLHIHKGPQCKCAHTTAFIGELKRLFDE